MPDINVGKWFNDTFGFDPTPGYNLSVNDYGVPYATQSGTKTSAGGAWNDIQATFDNGAQLSSASPRGASVVNQPLGGSNRNEGGAGTVAPGTVVDYGTVNARTLASLGQAADIIQRGLDRLPGQLEIARGNIDTQFNQRNNELDSDYASNEASYGQSKTQNSQNFRTNKNVINDQASTGLRGLLRLLGTYGATGTDLGLAGGAVADVQTAQNAGAGQTFSQNEQSLDANWGDYGNRFKNEKDKLTDWRTNQRNAAESASLTNKQELLTKLAGIRGEEAAARGGDYTGSAQPFLDQATALSGRIDNLGKLNPTYTGTTPVYGAAPLSSYNTANPATIGVAGGAGGGTPFLNAILGRDRKDRRFN